MTSTEVTRKAELDAAAESVLRSQVHEWDEGDIQTPLMKLAQGLTAEVQEGDADAGEFINTLTSEGLGDKVEFILVYYNRGRFVSDRESGRAWTAFTAEIPQRWADAVGEEWVGTPFTEYPEAEETYRARCNAKEIEWGHGPAVSTTHNYTGLVLTEDGPQPVRLSLKRTEKGAISKLNTLHRTGMLGKAPWDTVLSLQTTKKKFGRNESWIISPASIRKVRPTTPEEREAAAMLAVAASQGNTALIGDEDAERIAEPDAKGGLEV